MTLCTSSVVVVTACTEATYQYHIKTTGIPSQLYPRPKQKPRGSMARLVSERCSSSIWLAYPNRSHLRRNILLASCTCMVNCRQEKPRKHSKYTQQMQRYETVTFRQKVTNYPVPVLVKLLFFLNRCGPSLLPAHRQFRKTARGNSWRSCFEVHPDVCLNIGSSPRFGNLMQSTCKEPSAVVCCAPYYILPYLLSS